MTELLLGIIIGLLIRDIKFYTLKTVERIIHNDGKWTGNATTTQFLEPVSFKEKFDKAESVDDVLTNE